MFKRIKSLLQAGGPQDRVRRDRSQLEHAAAALLVEAAALDGHFDAAERATIARLLKERFSLSDAEVRDLIVEAEGIVANANELYTLSRAVKDGLAYEERVEIIEMLWHVAYADGHLHDFEANLVRRLAGLLYVSDRDSGEARKRVLAGLGLN